MRLLPAISRGWSGSAITAAAGTSMTISVSGATVGEWVYAYCSWRSNITSPGITGWITVCAMTAHGQASSGDAFLCRRRIVSGDSTFSLNWTTSAHCEVTLNQWVGLDATTPDEHAIITGVTGISGGVYTTSSVTPDGNDRWGVAYFDAFSNDSAHKQITWTPSAPISEVSNVFNPNSALAWFTTECSDTNGPVSAVPQSYSSTASTGGTVPTSGAVTILFLIPAQTAFQSAATLQAVNRAAVI